LYFIDSLQLLERHGLSARALLALVTIWPAALTCDPCDVLGTTIAYAVVSLYSRGEPDEATGGGGELQMLVDMCQMDGSVRRPCRVCH
jgi:hypothetical protein